MELSSGALSGWRVLICEDNADNATMFSMILCHFGAEVQVVGNGVDGLQQLGERDFTVVLCDLSMPLLDGWAFVRQARQQGIGKGVPIIAVTAHASVEERDKALAAGFVSTVTKPVSDTEGLVRFILDVVQRHQLEMDRSSRAGR